MIPFWWCQAVCSWISDVTWIGTAYPMTNQPGYSMGISSYCNKEELPLLDRMCFLSPSSIAEMQHQKPCFWAWAMYSETTFRLLTACGGEEPLLWWAWVNCGLGLTLRSHISCVSLYVGWLQQQWASATEFLLWPSQKKETFSETIFNLDRLSFLVCNKIHGTVENANSFSRGRTVIHLTFSPFVRVTPDSKILFLSLL